MMQMQIILITILLGITASILLNIGKGISKQGLKGMKGEPEKKRKHTAIWIGGMLMTTSNVVVNAFALSMGEASLIASLAGVGLVALIIFSYFVLHEKLDNIVYSGIALTIIGTVIVGIFTSESHPTTFNFINFWIMFIIFNVIIVFAIIYSITHGNKFYGFLFGALAGILSGFGIVLEKMGFILIDGVLHIFDNLLSPGNLIIYLAIIIAVGALAFTQQGLTKGKASILVPAYNSFYIIIPLMSEMLIFYNFLHPVQMVGILIIIIGIVLMTAFKQEEIDE